MDLAEGETILFEGHPSWKSVLALLRDRAGHRRGRRGDRDRGEGLRARGRGLARDRLGARRSLVGFLKRAATLYKVTNRRLWIRHGILSRAVQETRLDRVQNVNTRQTFFQRVLGIGTVDFDTAAGDDYDFSFSGVDDPETITRAVDRALGSGRAPRRPARPGPSPGRSRAGEGRGLRGGQTLIARVAQASDQQRFHPIEPLLHSRLRAETGSESPAPAPGAYATAPASIPAAARSASALSVFSQVKSASSRPKWPYAAVFW